MNKFFKVSFEQYSMSVEDALTEEGVKQLMDEYDGIPLPRKGTRNSAGYDFFAPFAFALIPGESIKIPTGIAVMLDCDKFLAVFPRSGLGFKYRLQLDNTVGIIDSDYFGSDNEGHIHIKLTNNGTKVLSVSKGEAFAQGIILKCYSSENGDSDVVRNGGFGSTDAMRADIES